MTRPSTTKLVEEVLENLDKLKMSGTLLKVARPRIHVSGLEISDSENRLALFKSPQLIHKFKDFLALAPQIFYDNDKKYVKALIIRKGGKDILYKFPAPKKSLVSKKPTKHELPKKSPASRDRQSLRSYIGKSELVGKDRIHSGMGPKLWDVFRKGDYIHHDDSDDDVPIYAESPIYTAEDNARDMAKLFRQYRPPEPPEIPNNVKYRYKPTHAEPRQTSGLPPLPTARTGWRYNYQVEAGPDEYRPVGRPRNDGTYKPYKAPYQTYSYEQTYTPYNEDGTGGQAYTHALGAEESKDEI